MSDDIINNDNLGETERILNEYQKDNIQLRSRLKELERQISTNDTDIRKENENLRRQILEMRGNQESIDAQYMKEEIVQYTQDTTAQLLTLKEENLKIKEENQRLNDELQNLNKRWDSDDKKNSSIENAINELRVAFVQGGKVGRAFDDLAAIICPECRVVDEKKESRKANQRLRSPGRYEISSLETRKLRERVEELEKKIEELEKVKQAPKRTNIPRLAGVGRVAPKIIELEQQVNEYRQKNEDLAKELNGLKTTSKGRNGKIKELQAQVNKAQEQLMEEQKLHQMDINEFTIQKSTMESQLKVLQTNADFRGDCERFRARVQILEAENSELKKPRPTGAAALDSVLDAISRMEGDIQQRQMDLNRLALKLEDKFEEERRQMENNHKKAIDEKNQQLCRLKREFEAILSDLERSKKRKAI